MNNPMEVFKKFMAMGKDPKQVEELIYQQNPQLRIISNQMKQSGLSPVDFVMQYAKQNNINLEQNAVLNMYQQMQQMIK